MRDYQQDIGAALAEAVERSAQGSKTTLKLRVWDVLRTNGYDLPDLEAAIAAEMHAERRRKKGRQANGPYNKPPKALERQFEHVVGTMQQPEPGTEPVKRYELQSPVTKYGRIDLSDDEMNALARFMHAGSISMRGPRITASYSNEPRGNPSYAGGVRDNDRLMHATFELQLSYLPAAWLGPVQQLIEGGATSITLGKWLIPSINTESSLRAAGRAFVKLLAQTLLANEAREFRGRKMQTAREQINREIAANFRAD